MTDGKLPPKLSGFAFIPGTDVGGPVHEGSPCIVCGKAVEPGTGAPAMPPLPALHGACLRSLNLVPPADE